MTETTLDIEKKVQDKLIEENYLKILEQLPSNLQDMLDEAEAIKKTVKETLILGIQIGIKLNELRR